MLRRLQDLHGAARLSDVTRTTSGRNALTRAVAAGDLTHERGVYALPGASPDVVTARALRGLLTCRSATDAFGLPALTPDRRTHLAVPRNRAVRLRDVPKGARVVIHREAGLVLPSAEDFPVVPLPEALARLARCVPERSAVATIDAALHRELVIPTDVATLLRGPGSRAARAALSRCDGRSASVLESIARLVLLDAGFTVTPAFHVPGVGWVDLLVEDRIVAELDGFAYHAGRAEYRNDRRRDRELAARGYVVLRFTWEDVMRDPDVIVRAVRAVLTRSVPTVGG